MNVPAPYNYRMKLTPSAVGLRGGQPAWRSPDRAGARRHPPLPERKGHPLLHGGRSEQPGTQV